MWKRISGLEQIVMDHVWANPGSTAEDCRQALAQSSRNLKDSTVRTLLHRLEQKGYLTHDVDGRTYRYRAPERRRNMAAQAVKQIIDQFCDGSVEQLLTGMVENSFVRQDELEELAKKIVKNKAARS
jgi:predicted transcriptional regulator